MKFRYEKLDDLNHKFITKMNTKIKILIFMFLVWIFSFFTFSWLIDNVKFNSPVKFDDDIITGQVDFIKAISGDFYKAEFVVFNEFWEEASTIIKVKDGDVYEVTWLTTNGKFIFYTWSSLSGCVILYSGSQNLEMKCEKIDFLADTVVPKIVDSKILGVIDGVDTGLVIYDGKRWINWEYDGVRLSWSVVDTGVGINRVKIILNNVEYKDLEFSGDNEVDIEEYIMSWDMKEWENKIEIVVEDVVGNKMIKEIGVYKDTIKPEIVDSKVLVKLNSGEVDSLLKDKYFNSYMKDLIVTWSLIETWSGLKDVIVYVSWVKNSQLEGYFSSIIWNNILFSGIFEDFYNKEQWPDGKYEIRIEFIDNVWNIEYKTIKDEIIKDVVPPKILGLFYKVDKTFHISWDCNTKLELSSWFVLKGCINYPLTNNYLIEFSWLVKENTSGLSGVMLKNVYYFSSWGNYTNVNLDLKYSIIGNNLSGIISGYNKDWLYFINFVLIDKAGNQISVIVDRPFMYDNNAPQIGKISVFENTSLTPISNFTDDSTFDNMFYIDGNSLLVPLKIDLTDLEKWINHVAGIEKVVVKKYYRKDWNVSFSTWWSYLSGKDDVYYVTGCDEQTFEWRCGFTSGYNININFSTNDGKPLDDGIYRVYIQVYDKAWNILESSDISNIYFVKDTDVAKVTRLRKYYMYSWVREDGWNITWINDVLFNLQPAVYIDKDWIRKQKFRLYYYCVDTGNISNKEFPERPWSTGVVYLQLLNYGNIIYSWIVDFSKCDNNTPINIIELTGFDLNKDYKFKIWLEDEIWNSWKDNNSRYESESFMTIPDYPKFILKYKNASSCLETMYVNSDCTLKKFETVDTDWDGSGDVMMFTTPTNSVYICFTGINQPVDVVIARYNLVDKRWSNWIDEKTLDLKSVTNGCYYLTGIFDSDNYDRVDFYIYFRSRKWKVCWTDNCDVWEDYVNMLKSRRVYVTLFKNEWIERLDRLDVFYNISIWTHLWYNPDSDERNRIGFWHGLMWENWKLKRNIKGSSKFNEIYISGDDEKQLLNWLRDRWFLDSNNKLQSSQVEGGYLYDNTNSNQNDKLSWLKLIWWIRKPRIIYSSVPTPNNILFLQQNKYDWIVSGVTIPIWTSIQRILLKPYFEDAADNFDITGNSYILEINPNINSWNIECFTNKCVRIYTLSWLYENLWSQQYKIIWKVNHYNWLANIQVSKTHFVVDMTPPHIYGLNAMISSLKNKYYFTVKDSQQYAFWEWLDKSNIRYYFFDITSWNYVKLCDWQNSNNMCRLEDWWWTDTDNDDTWYGYDSWHININPKKLEDGHLYKLVIQVRDDAGNWSNYTHNLDITNIIWSWYRWNDSNNDFVDRPILDNNLISTGWYWIYFRQDFTHPITHDIIKKWQQSINYWRDEDFNPANHWYHKIEEDEINSELTVDGLRFDIYAIYDYINWWSYFWYTWYYNDANENEKNFMKLANVNPATKDWDVGIVLRIKADEFSKWQEINTNDPSATGNLKHTWIYRLYRWVVTPNKTEKEASDWLNKWVNVVDVEKLIENTQWTTPNWLEVKIADWWKACKDIWWDNLDIVDIIDKKIENREVMTDYFTGDLIQQDDSWECKVVEPEVVTWDRYMDCLPNFLMYKKGDYYYIVTKVVAPKTRDSSLNDEEGSENFSGIIPSFVDNGIELRKHAWGWRNDYLANNISTQIKIRYQTLWWPPMPPEIIGYKGFVYKININNCSDKRLCNEVDKIITGDFDNWYLNWDYHWLQIFYWPYDKDTEKYVRLRSEDIFAANSSKRIAQIVCIKSSNYSYKLCYDLPWKNWAYLIDRIWIDKWWNARLFDPWIDIDLTSKYGWPSKWCKRIKVSIDWKTITSPTDSSILWKVYYQCDVPITDIINHSVNSVVTVSINSSWYSEWCQDTYSSVSSINKYFWFYSDFQKSKVSWFGVEGRKDNDSKRSRVAKWLSNGNQLDIWFFEPEREWWWKYNPDTAYLNNWKNSTWVEVYKIDDDWSETKKFDTRESSIKFNLKGAYVDDNYYRKWFTDKYNFEEWKYKIVVHFADAPMYSNTGIYVNYFFIDKNPPEIVDTLPYHKDSLIWDNTPWCLPYWVDCSYVKNKINKLYNIFYASNINHWGNIKTIYEWRDDLINDQWILVKDVSDIWADHTKFVLKMKDKNGNIKIVTSWKFDVKYGLGDSYNADSKNYRYFILSTSKYNNVARSFEPWEYWIEYTICDVFATPTNYDSNHCLTWKSVHWYYDPPLNKLSLSWLKVMYYDWSFLKWQRDLLSYLNLEKNRIDDTNISKYLKSDGRFLYIESSIVKNHNIDDDWDDVVPDNTQILVWLKKWEKFAVYDLNRNKKFNLNLNDWDDLSVKDGKIKFLLKLPNDNINRVFRLVLCPRYWRDPWGSINWASDIVPDWCVILEWNVWKIVNWYRSINILLSSGDDLLSYSPYLDNSNLSTQEGYVGSLTIYPAWNNLLKHDNKIYVWSGLIYSSWWLDAGYIFWKLIMDNISISLHPEINVWDSISSEELKTSFDIDNYLEVPKKILFASTKARIVYNVGYKWFDYDGDGNPDFINSVNYRWYRWAYPLKEVIWSWDNNCQYLWNINSHTGCTYFEIYSDNKKINKKTFKDVVWNKIRVFANADQKYNIHFYIRDRYWNNLDSVNSINDKSWDSLLLSWEGEWWCANQIIWCDKYKEWLLVNNFDYLGNQKNDWYFNFYVSSFIPTMSWNKVVARNIVGRFKLYLSYLKDIDWEKQIVIDFGSGDNIEKRFYLKFYPLVYVFLKNITKERIFKYWQEFKIQNYIKRLDSTPVNIWNITSFYNIYLDSKNPKIRQCSKMSYLVSLSSKDESIEDEVMKWEYYSFEGSDYVKLISWSSWKYLFFVPSKKFYTNQIDLLENGGSLTNDNQSLVEEIYNKVIYSGSDYRKDIKVKIDTNLWALNNDINLYLGGLIDVSECKNLNIDGLKDLVLDLSINSYLSYILSTDKWNYYIKLKTADAKYLLDYNTEIETDTGKILSTLEGEGSSWEEDKGTSKVKNIPKVIVNPTNIQGFVAWKGIFDILISRKRVRIKDKVVSLSKELNNVKKKIFTLIRWYNINYILNDTWIVIFDEINWWISSLLSLTPSISFEKKGENYYYYDFSNNLNWWNLIITGGYYIGKIIIIVRWADVYIKWNISKYELEDRNSWLVIIVLRWDNNKWWNVFIDPNVTNIDAYIIAEWSVLSAEDKNLDWYIDYSTEIIDENNYSIDKLQDILKNQLYIYWALHSRNTLWWAFEYKIPSVGYLILSGIEDVNIKTMEDYKKLVKVNPLKAQQIAKRFDINFLRYYLPLLSWDEVVGSYTWAKIAWWYKWDWNDWIDWDPSLRSSSDRFSTIIVQYDPVYRKFDILR